jgi:hypothetical protein
MCVVSAPIPLARPNDSERIPFTVGAIVEWDWRYSDQGAPHKWTTRFEKNGTYLGYMGSAYQGYWSWHGKTRTLRVYESLSPDNVRMTVSDPVVYVIRLNHKGHGTLETGATITLIPSVVIDPKTLKPK